MTNKLTIPAGTLKKGQLLRMTTVGNGVLKITTTVDPISLLSTKEQFVHWIVTVYGVHNDTLEDLMQDRDIQLKFLDANGLPEDTEL